MFKAGFGIRFFAMPNQIINIRELQISWYTHRDRIPFLQKGSVIDQNTCLAHINLTK